MLTTLIVEEEDEERLAFSDFQGMYVYVAYVKDSLAVENNIE